MWGWKYCIHHFRNHSRVTLCICLHTACSTTSHIWFPDMMFTVFHPGPELQCVASNWLNVCDKEGSYTMFKCQQLFLFYREQTRLLWKLILFQHDNPLINPVYTHIRQWGISNYLKLAYINCMDNSAELV